MKLPRTKVLFVSFVLALIVSIPAVVSAQGSPPHAFAGFAYIDNGAAPQGTIVHGVIDDIIVGQSSVAASGTYSCPSISSGIGSLIRRENRHLWGKRSGGL